LDDVLNSQKNRLGSAEIIKRLAAAPIMVSLFEELLGENND
jgi:hypothetical protein